MPDFGQNSKLAHRKPAVRKGFFEDLQQLEHRLAQFSSVHGGRSRPDLRGDAGMLEDPVSQLLHRSLGDALPGARCLHWERQPTGLVGRAAADGLVYRFRVDSTTISYRPAWDGLSESQWEVRSKGFLSARAPAIEARQDFRAARVRQRQCSRGYGCGSSCIAMAKICRVSPQSALSKERLSKLQVLAQKGHSQGQAMAMQVQGARNQQAAALREQRHLATLRQMLKDPKVAAMVRSGDPSQQSSTNALTERQSMAGTVKVLAPDQIEVDPKRFQYKLVSNAAGEVGSLRDVRKWDDNLAGVISVWQDPANGKTYVVNGPNRLGLAKRQGVEGVTVRYLRAANAKDARAIGALQNIAEGQGTEVDAAKFFRDSGIRNKADVEARGLPLTSGKAGRGLALAKLPREMFDRVVQGDLSVGRGAIIGASGLDASKQREIGKLLKARPSISDGTLGEYVEALAASQRQTQQTMNLFGNSTEEVETGLARAELVNGITRKIGKERRLFSMVSGSRAAATLQEKAGNQINREASGEVASAADRLGRMFKDMKNVSGPMSMAINRAASRVTAGEKREKVQRDLYEDVVKAMEAELERAGLAPKVPSKEAETTNLFDSAAAPAGMALLSILEDRMDALRRKCTTGYGCGSACISVQKECRARPASAMGRERIQRLQQLARGEIKPQGLGVPAPGDAAAMAQDLQGRRTARAAGLSKQRSARQTPSPDPAAGSPGGALVPARAPGAAIEAQVVAGQSTKTTPGGTPRISDMLRETLTALKAADARQMGRTAEHLFEAGWSLERRTTYKGMTKEQAREKFKKDFLLSMEKGAAQSEAAASLRDRAAKTGSLAGAMRVAVQAMKEQDRRLEDLERKALDLRVKAADVAMGATGNQEFADGTGKPVIPEVLPPGPIPSKTSAPGLETLAIVRQVMGNKKLRSDRQRIAEMIRLGIPADSDFVKLAAQSKVAGRPNDQQPVELTSPGRAAQPKPAANAGLNASDVVTATQQAQFARQQLEAAKAAGDEAGAKAWRKEEAAVQRARVRAAARRAQQNQASLFGVTEYDETMPLFKRRDGVIADLEARLDALRRKCTTGYGCGSTCISVQKECRTQPSSAIGRQRLKRLQQLARGEIKPQGLGVPKASDAEAMATDLQGRRSSKARELSEQRQAAKAVKAANAKKSITSTSKESPRSEAETVEGSGDYKFARKSSISNAGEDIANSARHRRNAFRSLEEAEASGEVEKLLTRDNLMKNFPTDLISGITAQNALSRLEAHYSLKAFPNLNAETVERYVRDAERRRERAASLPSGKSAFSSVDAKTVRKQYFDGFQTVRKFVEDNKDMEPGQLRRNLASKIKELIDTYRGTDGTGWYATSKDPFNPTANALVGMQKKLIYPGATSVHGQMNAFAKALNEVGKLNKDNARSTLEHAADAASKIMEGQTLAKAFGQEGSNGKWRFNPADHYVGHARREGGRKVGGTAKTATDTIIQGLGFRGLQYGNSVTDDERAHHVQKAAEALVDLADAINLPDKAIGLNGTLGLAIGARGQGGAVAHYEPGMKVINLTRKNGVGSLSHEWGHALDDYVSGAMGFLSQSRSQSRGGNSAESVQAMGALQASWRESGFTTQVYATIRQIKKAGGMIAESYWLSDVEMFARSFEAHVSLKLAKAGRTNTYLTREFGESGMRKGNIREGGGNGLWPTRQQAEAMEPMFDRLLAQLRKEKFPGETNRSDSRDERIWRFMHAMTG